MPEKHEVTPDDLKILIEAAACWDEVLWSGGCVPDDAEQCDFYNKLAVLLERLGERYAAEDGARYEIDMNEEYEGGRTCCFSRPLTGKLGYIKAITENTQVNHKRVNVNHKSTRDIRGSQSEM